MRNFAKVWLAVVVVLVALGALGGCGPRRHYYGGGVIVYSDPFTVTLVNGSGSYVAPGPIVLQPGSVIFSALPAIPPGGTTRIEVDFVPSTIIIGSAILEVGHDYGYGDRGVTFIYR